MFIVPDGALADAFNSLLKEYPAKVYSYLTLQEEIARRAIPNVTVEFQRYDVDGDSPRIMLLTFTNTSSLRRSNGKAHLVISRESGRKLEFHNQWKPAESSGKLMIVPTFMIEGGTIQPGYENVSLSDWLTTAMGQKPVPLPAQPEDVMSSLLLFNEPFSHLRGFLTETTYVTRRDLIRWLKEAQRELEKKQVSP